MKIEIIIDGRKYWFFVVDGLAEVLGRINPMNLDTVRSELNALGYTLKH